MKNFIVENWLYISPIVAEIALRLWPTKKNYSIIDNTVKLLNYIIPNIRKKDSLNILLFVLLSISAVAQNNVPGKLFYSYNVSDTAAAQALRLTVQNLHGNTGGLYFDEGRNKWKVWDSSCSCWRDWTLFSSSGIVGNFWPLTGSADFTGNVTVRTREDGFTLIGGSLAAANHSIVGVDSITTFIEADDSDEAIAFTLRNDGATSLLAEFSDSRLTTRGIQYAADYSAGFNNRSLIDVGTANSRYWPLAGTGTFTDEVVINANNEIFSYNNGAEINFSSEGNFQLAAGQDPGETLDITSHTTNISGTVAININTAAGGLGITTTPTADNTVTSILGLTAGGGVRVRTAASLAATAAGSDTQIQYNNSGSFAGNAGFVITPGSPAVTSNRLSVIAPAGSSEGRILLTATDDAGGGSTLTLDGLTFSESSFQPALSYTFSNTTFSMSPITNGEFDITTSGATSNSLWNFGNGFSGASVEFRNGVAGTGDLRIIMNDLPTACTGLATGTLWNNAGVLSICP